MDYKCVECGAEFDELDVHIAMTEVFDYWEMVYLKENFGEDFPFHCPDCGGELTES